MKGGGLAFHQGFLLKNHLESLPDCQNAVCTYIVWALYYVNIVVQVTLNLLFHRHHGQKQWNLDFGPCLKSHSHVLLQTMKRKQLLTSKIFANTTLVPTKLSKDSYSSGETLATPYVRDNELLQCEVNIHFDNDIIHLRMDLSRSRYQKPATKKFFINIGKSKEILKKVNANQYQHNKII